MEATNRSCTLNMYSFKIENPSLPDSISESSLATLEIRMMGSFGGGAEGAPYESLIPYVEGFVGEAAEALGFKESLGWWLRFMLPLLTLLINNM
ncbi:hypothetical protein TorRG33x02_031860 [Trema orientale]|uniref:Uncharacterized protein n=1 Tax=Trema orientale TaxID=63057 RepID=A0A2P5FT79_TREOI|nr:hypothetical protein TorRG33x02_031860 [Trema orientale]